MFFPCDIEALPDSSACVGAVLDTAPGMPFANHLSLMFLQLKSSDLNAVA